MRVKQNLREAREYKCATYHKFPSRMLRYVRAGGRGGQENRKEGGEREGGPRVRAHRDRAENLFLLHARRPRRVLTILLGAFVRFRDTSNVRIEPLAFCISLLLKILEESDDNDQVDLLTIIIIIDRYVIVRDNVKSRGRDISIFVSYVCSTFLRSCAFLSEISLGKSRRFLFLSERVREFSQKLNLKLITNFLAVQLRDTIPF